ncbi:MAG: hypothetical protein JSS20_11670, partial [Proteobacteria bacterium]|nr:hypothetical protein [Pseudomonadota bacterium]
MNFLKLIRHRLTNLPDDTPANGNAAYGFHANGRSLDAIGDWLIARVAQQADSALSQWIYVLRLQLWPILFAFLWVVICCVPNQVVEFYAAVLQNTRNSGEWISLGLLRLLLPTMGPPIAIYFSAYFLAALPGPMHFGATRKLAARLSILIPFWLLVISSLAIPVGILQPQTQRILEPEDFSAVVLLLAAYVCVVGLAVILIILTTRSRGSHAFSVAPKIYAIAGSRARRNVASLALLAIVSAGISIAGLLSPLAFGTVSDITDNVAILPHAEFMLMQAAATFVTLLTVTLTSLSYLFRRVIGFPLIP